MRTSELPPAREYQDLDRNATSPRADGQAWRREMERLAVQSWFYGAIEVTHDDPAKGVSRTVDRADSAGQGVAGAPAAGGQRNASAEQSERPLSSAKSFGPDMGPQGVRLLSQVGDAAPIAQLADGASWLRRLDATPTDVNRTLPPQRITQVEPSREPRCINVALLVPSAGLPVSVHVEGGPTGTKVWLGVPMMPGGIDVAAIQLAVGRWLARQGYDAADWICNGEPLPPLKPGSSKPGNQLDDFIKEIS